MVHRGRLVAERYGGRLEHFDRPAETVGPDTPLLSWSMAKSVLHAVVGMLVADGRLDPTARPGARVGGARRPPPGHHPRPTAGHARRTRLRRGLRRRRVSDVIEMLFGTGQDDMAHFAADRRWPRRPGSGSTTRAGPPTSSRASWPGPSDRASPTAGSWPTGCSDRSGRPRPGPLGRGRHLGGLLLRPRHRPRLRPLRPALPARRGFGRPARPPGRMGGHGPRAPARSTPRTAPSRRPLVGGRRGATAPSAPGYEGQSSPCARPSTWWWCGWARPRPSASPSWAAGGPAMIGAFAGARRALRRPRSRSRGRGR